MKVFAKINKISTTLMNLSDSVVDCFSFYSHCNIDRIKI